MSGAEKRYIGPKLFNSDWENISKYITLLDLFCQATVLPGGDKYVAYGCVLSPLILSLIKQVTVNDVDPGYIARFKAA